MKTAKELKKYVFSRIMCCFGELCTVFFLTVGGLSVFVLACITAGELLFEAGREKFLAEEAVYPYGTMFLICTAAFILLLVAATPFFYGMCWYRIQQVRGNSVHARSIFSCYTSLGKLWRVLHLNSILIIKQLYVIIPAAGISALGFYISGLVEDRTNSRAAYYAVFVLALAVTAGMICLIFVFNMKYTAVPYLYVLEPNRTSSELIEESIRLMQGKKRYIFKIIQSLAVWLIPCLIIFPMIFVVPYIQMVFAAAVNEIILSGHGEEEHSGGDDESNGNSDSGTQLFMPEGTS